MSYVKYALSLNIVKTKNKQTLQTKTINVLTPIYTWSTIILTWPNLLTTWPKISNNLVPIFKNPITIVCHFSQLGPNLPKQLGQNFYQPVSQTSWSKSSNNLAKTSINLSPKHLGLNLLTACPYLSTTVHKFPTSWPQSSNNIASHFQQHAPNYPRSFNIKAPLLLQMFNMTQNLPPLMWHKSALDKLFVFNVNP